MTEEESFFSDKCPQSPQHAVVFPEVETPAGRKFLVPQIGEGRTVVQIEAIPIFPKIRSQGFGVTLPDPIVISPKIEPTAQAVALTRLEGGPQGFLVRRKFAVADIQPPIFMQDQRIRPRLLDVGNNILRGITAKIVEIMVDPQRGPFERTRSPRQTKTERIPIEDGASGCPLPRTILEIPSDAQPSRICSDTRGKSLDRIGQGIGALQKEFDVVRPPPVVARVKTHKWRNFSRKIPRFRRGNFSPETRPGLNIRSVNFSRKLPESPIRIP